MIPSAIWAPAFAGVTRREAKRSLLRRAAGALLALDREEGGRLGLGRQLDGPFHHAREPRRLAADDPAFVGIGHRIAGEGKGIGRAVDADVEAAGPRASVGFR